MRVCYGRIASRSNLEGLLLVRFPEEGARLVMARRRTRDEIESANSGVVFKLPNDHFWNRGIRCFGEWHVVVNYDLNT